MAFIIELTDKDHGILGLGRIKYRYKKPEENGMDIPTLDIIVEDAIVRTYYGNRAMMVLTGVMDESHEAYVRAEINRRCIEAFGVELSTLDEDTRDHDVVEKRFIVFWWAKKNTRLKDAAIGALAANRDRGTVLHAVKTVNNMLDVKDRRYMQLVKAFESANQNNLEKMLP